MKVESEGDLGATLRSVRAPQCVMRCHDIRCFVYSRLGKTMAGEMILRQL
jgi:hypothetical protein